MGSTAMFIRHIFLTGAILSSLVASVFSSLTLSSPKAQTLEPFTLFSVMSSTTPSSNTASSRMTVANVSSVKTDIVAAVNVTFPAVDNIMAALEKNVTNKTLDNEDIINITGNVTGNAEHNMKMSTKEGKMTNIVTPVASGTTKLPWTKWSQKKRKFISTSVFLPVLTPTGSPLPKSTTSRSAAVSGKSLVYTSSTKKSFIPSDVEWVPMNAMERNGQVTNHSTSSPMLRDFIFRVKSSFANPSGAVRSSSSDKDSPISNPANVAFVTKVRSPSRRPPFLAATQRPMASITFVSPSQTADDTGGNLSTLTEELIIGNGDSSEVSTSIIKLKHKSTTGSQLFVATEEVPLIPKPGLINVTNATHTTISPQLPSNTSPTQVLNTAYNVSTTTPVLPTTRRGTGITPPRKNKPPHQQNTSDSLQAMEQPQLTAEDIIRSAAEVNRTSVQQSKSKFKPAGEKIWIPVSVSAPPLRTRPSSGSNQMIVKTPTRLKTTKKPTIKTTTPKSITNGSNTSLKYKDSYDANYFDKLADPLSEALLSSDIMYANTDSFGDNSVYAHTTVRAPPGYEQTTPGYVTLAWSNDYGPTTPSNIFSTTFSSSSHPLLISALSHGPDFAIYEDQIRDKPLANPGQEYDSEYVHSEAPASVYQKPLISEEVSYDKTPYASPNAHTTIRPVYKPVYTTTSSSSYGNEYQTGRPIYSNKPHKPNKPIHHSQQAVNPNYGNPHSVPQAGDHSYQINNDKYEPNTEPQNGEYASKKPSYGSYHTTKAPYGISYETAKPSYSDPYPTDGNSYETTKPNYGNSYESTIPTYDTSYETAKPAYGNSYVTTKPTYDTSYETAKPAYGNSYVTTKPTYDTSYETAKPAYGNSYVTTKPTYGNSYQQTNPTYGDSHGPTKPDYGNSYGATTIGYGTKYGPTTSTYNGGYENKPVITTSYQIKRPTPGNSYQTLNIEYGEAYEFQTPMPLPSHNYAESNKNQQRPSYYGQEGLTSGQSPSYTTNANSPSQPNYSNYNKPSTMPSSSYSNGNNNGQQRPSYYGQESQSPQNIVYTTKPPAYYSTTIKSHGSPGYHAVYPQSSPPPPYYSGEVPAPALYPPVYYPSTPSTSYTTNQVYTQKPVYGSKPQTPPYYDGGDPNYSTTPYYKPQIQPSYYDNGKPDLAGPNYASDDEYNPYQKPVTPNYEGEHNQYATGNYANKGKPSYGDSGANIYPPGYYEGSGNNPYKDGGVNTFQHNDGGTDQGNNDNTELEPMPDDGGSSVNFPILVGDEATGLDAAGLAAILLSIANRTELDFEDQSDPPTVARPVHQSASSGATNLRPFSTGTASNLANMLLSLTSTTQRPNDPEQEQFDEGQAEGGGATDEGNSGTLQKLLLAIGMSVIPTATIAVLVGFPALLIGRRRRDVGEGNNKERVAQLIDEVNASMEKYVSSLPDTLTAEKGDELRRFCAQTLEDASKSTGGRPRDWMKMRKPKKHDGITWKKIFHHVRSFLPNLRFNIQNNESATRNNNIDSNENKTESGIMYIPVNPEEVISAWHTPSTRKRPGNALKNKLNATSYSSLSSSSLEEMIKPAALPVGIQTRFQEMLCEKIMSLLEEDVEEYDSDLEDMYGDVTHDVSKEVPDVEEPPVINTLKTTNGTLTRVTHTASITVPDLEAAKHLFQQGVISQVIANNNNDGINNKNNSNANKLNKHGAKESENNSSLNRELSERIRQHPPVIVKRKDDGNLQDKDNKDDSNERGKTMQINDDDITILQENAVTSDQSIPPIKFIVNPKDMNDSSTKTNGPLAVIIVYDENNYTVSYLDRRLIKKRQLGMQLKSSNNKHQKTTSEIYTSHNKVHIKDPGMDKTNRYEEIMLLAVQPENMTALNALSDARRFTDKKKAKQEFNFGPSKPTRRPNTRYFSKNTEHKLQRGKSVDTMKALPVLDFGNSWKDLNHILTTLFQTSLNSSDDDNSFQNAVELSPHERNMSATNTSHSPSRPYLDSEKANVQNLSWVARPRRDVKKLNFISSTIRKDGMSDKIVVNKNSTAHRNLVGRQHNRKILPNTTKSPVSSKRNSYKKKRNTTEKYNKWSRMNSTKYLKSADFKLLESQRSNSVSSLLPLPKIPDNIHEGKLYIYHLLMSPKSPTEDTTTSASVVQRKATTEKSTSADDEENDEENDEDVKPIQNRPRTTTVYPRVSTTTSPSTTTVSKAKPSNSNSNSSSNLTKDIRSVHSGLFPHLGMVPHGQPIPPVPSVFRIPIQVENSTPEYMHIIGSPISWPLHHHLPQPNYTPYLPTTTTTFIATTTPRPHYNWLHPNWGNWYFPNSQTRPPIHNPIRPNRPISAVPINDIWYTTNASQSKPYSQATAILSSVPPPATNSTGSAAAAPTTINIYTIHGFSSDLLPFIKNPAATTQRTSDGGYSYVTTESPFTSEDYYDDDYEDAEYDIQPTPPPIVTKRPTRPPRPTSRPLPTRRPTTRRPFRPRPTLPPDVFQDPPFFEATTRRIRPANIRPPRPAPQVDGGACADCTPTITPVAINPIRTNGIKKPTQAIRTSLLDLINQKLGLNAQGGLLPLIDLGNMGLFSDPWGQNANIWWNGDKRSMDGNNTKRLGISAQHPLISALFGNQTVMQRNQPQKKRRRQKPMKRLRTNPRFLKILDKIASSARNGLSNESDDHAGPANVTSLKFAEAFYQDNGISPNSTTPWKNRRRVLQRLINSTANLSVSTSENTTDSTNSSLKSEFGRNPGIRRKYRRRKLKPRGRDLHDDDTSSSSVEEPAQSETNKTQIYETTLPPLLNSTTLRPV